MQADRGVYLGDEGLVVRRRSQIGDSGAAQSLWVKSLSCVNAPPERIDRFVTAERRKHDWQRLEPIPKGEVVFFGLSQDRILAACDRVDVNDVDIADAELVALPRAPQPGTSFEVVQEGGRILVLPGTLDGAGVVLISDELTLQIDVYNLQGKQLQSFTFDSAAEF